MNDIKIKVFLFVCGHQCYWFFEASILSLVIYFHCSLYSSYYFNSHSCLLVSSKLHFMLIIYNFFFILISNTTSFSSCLSIWLHFKIVFHFVFDPCHSNGMLVYFKDQTYPIKNSKTIFNVIDVFSTISFIWYLKLISTISFNAF